MCLLPIGGTPRSDTYCDMIFYVPTMLLMAGSALGLMGIVLDRRKILAVIETILSLAMFFLILSVYPMFSGGPP